MNLCFSNLGFKHIFQIYFQVKVNETGSTLWILNNILIEMNKQLQIYNFVMNSLGKFRLCPVMLPYLYAEQRQENLPALCRKTTGCINPATT